LSNGLGHDEGRCQPGSAPPASGGPWDTPARPADSAGQYDPQTRAVYWLLDELPPNEMGNVTVTGAWATYLYRHWSQGSLPLRDWNASDHG